MMFLPRRKEAYSKFVQLGYRWEGIGAISTTVASFLSVSEHGESFAKPPEPSSSFSKKKRRPLPPPPPPPGKIELPGVDHIIAVASGKGGVGKSTTAVNISVGLARMGLKVGLLDADIYGPSVPKLLNLHGKPDIDPDEKMIPLRQHGVKAMSMGFLMDERQAAVWRGPMVQSAIQTLISQVRWAPLDCLILDMPPGTGDAQLTVSQRLHLSGAIIVSTPQDLALLDARRGVTMFQKVDVPILGLVENMSSFICSNCGHESFIFGSGGVERTASELGVDVLGKIPLVTDIRESSDDGFPIVVNHPDSLASKAYMEVVNNVWKKLTQPSSDG